MSEKLDLIKPVRLIGAAILYAAEIAFPPSPSVETRAANITIYPARPTEPEDRAA